MVSRGWATEYASFQALCKVHGGNAESAPLSKLGLVLKQRSDDSWKHRLVWDLRRVAPTRHCGKGSGLCCPAL
eukprot:5877622-Amphidinium_carterae.1